MFGKGSIETEIVISTINAHIYIEMIDDFFPLIENKFGDDKVIFQGDNASYQRVASVIVFWQERYIDLMT